MFFFKCYLDLKRHMLAADIIGAIYRHPASSPNVASVVNLVCTRRHKSL